MAIMVKNKMDDSDSKVPKYNWDPNDIQSMHSAMIKMAQDNMPEGTTLAPVVPPTSPSDPKGVLKLIEAVTLALKAVQLKFIDDIKKNLEEFFGATHNMDWLKNNDNIKVHDLTAFLYKTMEPGAGKKHLMHQDDDNIM